MSPPRLLAVARHPARWRPNPIHAHRVHRSRRHHQRGNPERPDRARPALAGDYDGLAREHLHAFVREVELTPAEWLRAIDFLARTGQTCSGAAPGVHPPLRHAGRLDAGRTRSPTPGCPPAGRRARCSAPSTPPMRRRIANGATIARGAQGRARPWCAAASSGRARQPGPRRAHVETWETDGDGFYDTQYGPSAATSPTTAPPCTRMRPAGSGSTRRQAGQLPDPDRRPGRRDAPGAPARRNGAPPTCTSRSARPASQPIVTALLHRRRPVLGDRRRLRRAPRWSPSTSPTTQPATAPRRKSRRAGSWSTTSCWRIACRVPLHRLVEYRPLNPARARPA